MPGQRPSLLSLLSRRERGWTKQALLLQLEFAELLFSVHFNDEWNHQDEERGPRNPRRFSGAFEEFFGDVGRVGGRAFGVGHNWGVWNGTVDPSENACVVVAGGNALFALIGRHERSREKGEEGLGFFV